jgi:hypothetical protein
VASSDPTAAGTGDAMCRQYGAEEWVGERTNVWACPYLTYFKIIQTHSNLVQRKISLLGFDKFKIKYGYEGFYLRNIFPYRNFSRFEMVFELKIKEASSIWISMKFDEIFLGTSRFDEIWAKALVCT